MESKMVIRLLGTGAADGIPGFYADNEVSRYARENGGKDLRTRTAALIDGVLKIDLPPDTLCQMMRDGLDARDWSALIFTHSHEDHLAASEIQYALFPFTELEQLPFSIYSNAMVASYIRARYPDWPIDLQETHSFHSFVHGPYTITPIAANHKEDEDSQNLIFQRDGKTFLYGTDTGIWPEATFEFLKGYRLDALVIECTEGYRRTPYLGHLNFEDLAIVLDRLRSTGVLDSKSRVITTHHAHTGGANHHQLEIELAKIGAEPGYDGMLIEL